MKTERSGVEPFEKLEESPPPDTPLPPLSERGEAPQRGQTVTPKSPVPSHSSPDAPTPTPPTIHFQLKKERDRSGDRPQHLSLYLEDLSPARK